MWRHGATAVYALRLHTARTAPATIGSICRSEFLPEYWSSLKSESEPAKSIDVARVLMPVPSHFGESNTFLCARVCARLCMRTCRGAIGTKGLGLQSHWD